MFENIKKFFNKKNKKEEKISSNSKNTAKERLHLVLMQDRANVSADFLELMKQEIIEVIKKYIDVDESAIDVRLTNKENEDGTNGAPALYANIPIINIKNESKKVQSERNEEKNEINESENKEKNQEETIIKINQEIEKITENEEKQEDIVKENKEKTIEPEQEENDNNQNDKNEKEEKLEKKEEVKEKIIKSKEKVNLKN